MEFKIVLITSLISLISRGLVTISNPVVLVGLFPIMAFLTDVLPRYNDVLSVSNADGDSTDASLTIDLMGLLSPAGNGMRVEIPSFVLMTDSTSIPIVFGEDI